MAVVVVAVLIGGAWAAAPYVASTAFLLDLSGTAQGLRRVLPVRVHAVHTRDLTVPTRDGPVAARLYEPSAASDRSVIVFPGVHAGGNDEPRLVAFSRRLAGTGVRVLTVPLPELRRFQITPSSTDMIEDATRWMADNPALAPDGHVALAGISFAGGLALVAAGRPALAGKLQLVFALGGHADLPRVMRYLCTGRLPDGTIRPPHDYGVALITLAALPHLVPASQVEAARQAVLAFLDASSLASTDEAGAMAIFASARLATAALPEPSRSLVRLVNNRDVTDAGAEAPAVHRGLGRRLGPFARPVAGHARAGLPAARRGGQRHPVNRDARARPLPRSPRRAPRAVAADTAHLARRPPRTGPLGFVAARYGSGRICSPQRQAEYWQASPGPDRRPRLAEHARRILTSGQTIAGGLFEPAALRRRPAAPSARPAPSSRRR